MNFLKLFHCSIFSNIPLLMVAVFLMIILTIGLYDSPKITTLRDAKGKKQFATATLLAAMLATHFGGGALVREVCFIHSLGLYWIIIIVIDSLAFWLLQLLARHMGPFMGHLSMAETIGNVYGNIPRLIVAFSSICTTIADVALQINVAAMAIKNCTNLSDTRLVFAIASCILIVYAILGGIRTATITDIVQLITFSIIIPLLTVIILRQVNKPIETIITFLGSQEKFQLKYIFRFDKSCLSLLMLSLSVLTCHIRPTTIQQIYMASGPIQAKKILQYSCLFSLIIIGCIILLSLFVFVSAPHLSQGEIWPYITNRIHPFLKGLISISMLAVAISSANSKLNTCAITMRHDILAIIRKVKHTSYTHSLLLAKVTSGTVGVLAMLLAFLHQDLLFLLKLTFASSLPIVGMPFILAILGFRGSSRTTVISMVTGIIAIIAWHKWVQSLEQTVGIEGAFCCMLVNGLAMFTAHHLLPQPAGIGWIGPNEEWEQIQQAKKRKKIREQEAKKAFFTRTNIAKLKPTRMMLILVGIHITVTSCVNLYLETKEASILWPSCLLVLGAISAGYGVFLFFSNYKLPDWIIGSAWLLMIGCGLPLHILYSWWKVEILLFPLSLVLMHGAVNIWILPVYWGIRSMAATVIVMTILTYFKESLLWPSAMVLFILLGISIIFLVIILYAKYHITQQTNQTLYLKQQQQLNQIQEIKKMAYKWANNVPTSHNELATEGALLESIVKEITQSITFLDQSTPLYKEDLQSILNRFSEWAYFLKQEAKRQEHYLLQPAEIFIQALVNEIEVTLEKELGYMPRLFIQYGDSHIPNSIIGDINKIVHLLVKFMIGIIKHNHLSDQWVKIAFYTTQLQHERCEPIGNSYPEPLIFQAIAMVISCATTPVADLPKVERTYQKGNFKQAPKKQLSQKTMHNYLDQRTMARIIQAHYGYLEIGTPSAILLVLPCNVQAIRKEMVSKLPITQLTTEEAAITPEEEADAMVVLMSFYDHVCQMGYVEPALLAAILHLVKHYYEYKRHASGQLLYIRAIGIAKIVASWLFHSPKPIYAALLYDLVRYTHLPLSYIKTHFDMGTYCFVEAILKIDSTQKLEESLLFMHNRFKETIAQERFSVLYIKLAERLYDLQHATCYTNPAIAQQMVKETLTIDIILAKKYLEPHIALALEETAKQVKDYYHKQCKQVNAYCNRQCNCPYLC